MNWIRFYSAIIATLGLTTVAQANILDLFDGSGKSCGCASSCQPESCKPTITRPCETTVHTYQRQVTDKKPPCCKQQCAPQKCCRPAPKCCEPAPKCVKPAPRCCEPTSQVPAKPVSHDCCQPRQRDCCQPRQRDCCRGPGLLKRLWDRRPRFGWGHDCCRPQKQCCEPAPQKDCCHQQQKRCDADPCAIAELIYESQTACYAKDRRRAIHKLGDKYDCQCNPEIMAAMIYALNDADEGVRKKAADEIGDQLRKNPGCCSKEVAEALRAALADCDKGVRRQAEEGLEACGYCVVDGQCDTCRQPSCCGPGGHHHGVEPQPAPAPPTEAHFAPTIRRKTASHGNRLASLFGLFD